MKRLASVTLIGASAILLAACNTATTRTVTTPARVGHVLFDNPSFDGVAPVRVGWVDIWREEEYSRFTSKGAQSEIIYSVADERDSIVLDFDMTLDRMIDNWHAASSRGDKGSAETPLGTFQYQHFSQAGRSCVGFFNEWDYRQGDRQLLPAKVLFGYYCGTSGQTLNSNDVANILGDIWIRDIDRTDYRFTPRLALASSGKPSSMGNLQFPSAPADRFVDADGERDGG